MNCVVIDDNPSDQDLLCAMIDQTPGISMISSFDLGLPALEFLKHNKQADLIFLDIEMPDISGLYFLELLPNTHSYLIIFTSGHTDTAILGINQHDQVIGFLEKIYSYQEFYRVIQKARRLLSQGNFPETNHQISKDNETVFIKTSFNRKERYERINLNDLLFIQSERNYVHLVTDRNDYLVKNSLSDMQQQLHNKSFVRVHKSFLINLQRIQRIEAKQVLMDNEIAITVSETYRPDLIQRVSEFSIEDK